MFLSGIMDTQDTHFLLDFLRLKEKIFESKPERGDIIVFKLPGQENINYVKRLVGLPGETIKVVNGKIYLKTKNATDFEVLDQIEDGFFYDDQYTRKFSS